MFVVLGSKFTDYDKKSSVSTTDDESSSTWNTITEVRTCVLYVCFKGVVSWVLYLLH